jgi:hypothetical protein
MFKYKVFLIIVLILSIQNFAVSDENGYIYFDDYPLNEDQINNKENISDDEFLGKFVLDEYRIRDISNMELNENQVIIVERDRRGGRILNFVHTGAWSFPSNQPSYITKENNIYTFFKIHADGDTFGYTIKYYFLDKNTIIFEYQWGETNDNNEYAYIYYWARFKREEIVD